MKDKVCIHMSLKHVFIVSGSLIMLGTAGLVAWLLVGQKQYGLLRPDDVVFGTYRSHAFYLAKGGDLKKMVAEMYGKVTGCAKGKGGSMHLIDADNGIIFIDDR